MYIGETTCDGKKKMYELLNEKRPTYVLHLPQGHDGDPLTAWTKELHRFLAYLEENFGITITEEALREASGDIVTIANREGLTAHANSITVRFED